MATINGVLKAWMVPPDYPDAARHAEAVLAKLAGWRSEGVLWGVSADTVCYNTCINCWKESRIPGAAQRATDILRLMEDATTAVVPDAVSYATCIGAWADRAAKDPAVAQRADDILMRMYRRSQDAAGDVPMPTAGRAGAARTPWNYSSSWSSSIPPENMRICLSIGTRSTFAVLWRERRF